MTWLYVPGTASNFAQASEDLGSACPSLNPDIAPSLTWRGKPMLPASLSRAWKRASWMRRLSGLTLPPSTVDHGVAAFISSLPEIHANRTATPASEVASATIGSSSIKSCASSMRAGLIVSSERTSQGMRTGSYTRWSTHWKEWVSSLRLESGGRRMSARHMAESDCSSWPTASVADSRNSRNSTAGRSGTGKDFVLGDTLSDALITRWGTPRAADGMQRLLVKGRPDRARLEDQVANWATPCTLDYQTERDFHSLHPARLIPDGPTSSAPRLNLNPRFVEWLMGWPIGWTSFEHAETGLSAWLLRMRGELSMLCTRTDAQQRLF